MVSAGLLERRIAETPISILDFETTGLSAGADRVVEVSVVRIEPGEEPRLVLDTLVNPDRRMSATDIHGISGDDVVDGPRFEEIAGDVVRAIHNSVVAAYNVYFDINFLKYELSRVGINDGPPYLCLMYMRPMLGLGKRCSLSDACQSHGIDRNQTHTSGVDTEAAGQLWKIYLQEFENKGVRTFGELSRLKDYKFVQSFSLEPFCPPLGADLSSCTRLKSRRSSSRAGQVITPRNSAYEYWEALKVTVCDLQVTPDEIDYLTQKQQDLQLSVEELRSLHARMFAMVIAQFTEDKRLDDQECRKLRKLHECLAKLGWAPGL